MDGWVDFMVPSCFHRCVTTPDLPFTVIDKETEHWDRTFVDSLLPKRYLYALQTTFSQMDFTQFLGITLPKMEFPTSSYTCMTSDITHTTVLTHVYFLFCIKARG